MTKSADAPARKRLVQSHASAIAAEERAAAVTRRLRTAPLDFSLP
jgi:hypothetical protein